MDWLRISLVVLGLVLIAGIWFAHRLRSSSRRRLDDVHRDDWDEGEAVHIRAGPETDDLPEVSGTATAAGAPAASAPGPRAEGKPPAEVDDGWGPPPTPPAAASQGSLSSIWSKLRAGKPRDAAPPQPKGEATGGAGAAAGEAEAKARQRPLWEEFDDISKPRVVGRNPLASGPHDDAGGESVKILLLHVVAPRNRPFTGVAIGAALRRAGLALGDLAIYHLQGPEGEILFSAANMVPPGTLRDVDLADMTTPGLSLFVQVHATRQPHLAFEQWLEKTHQLARDLGGSILDAHQSTATNQTLAHLREDMNQWLLRHRPDVLRGKS